MGKKEKKKKERGKGKEEISRFYNLFNYYYVN